MPKFKKNDTSKTELETLREIYQNGKEAKAKIKDGLIEKLKELEAEESTLNALEESASNSNNPEEFLELRQKLRTNRDLQDFYRNKLNSVKVAPYEISAEEILKRIEAEQKRLDTEVLREVFPSIKEVREKMDKAYEDNDELNRIKIDVIREMGRNTTYHDNYVLWTLNILSNPLNKALVEHIEKKL